jgi:hypothetical protein
LSYAGIDMRIYFQPNAHSSSNIMIELPQRFVQAAFWRIFL